MTAPEHQRQSGDDLALRHATSLPPRRKGKASSFGRGISLPEKIAPPPSAIEIDNAFETSQDGEAIVHSIFMVCRRCRKVNELTAASEQELPLSGACGHCGETLLFGRPSAKKAVVPDALYDAKGFRRFWREPIKMRNPESDGE